ncbi:MAG TPA: hypothetical protein VIO60_08055 [Rectinemataceae bacterium]
MTKRMLLALALLALAFAALPAQGKPSYGAGFFFNLFPMFEYTTRPSLSSVSDKALGEFFEKPTFASGGVFLTKGPITAIGIMEFQQDIWSKTYKQSNFNLPDSRTGWYPDIIDLGTCYPNVGYVDYDADGIRFSVGRRKIKDGPGTYGLGLSSYNPYYDHAAASLAVAVGPGKLSYDYVAVGMQRYYNDAYTVSGMEPKYYFFHRAAWTGQKFSFAINEYTLVDQPDPDFQDWGPFLFYHNLFNNHQNVMAGFDFAWTPKESLAFYGQFILDDFMLSTEAGSNPTAIGGMIGADINIIPGEAPRGAKYYDSDYTYYVGRSQKTRGGLNLKLEGYLMSRYLYRRQEGASTEAFTGQYYIFSNWPQGSVDSRPFLATPLAPDTALARLALDWVSAPFEASFAFEYRLVGSESATKTYSYSTLDYDNWLMPSSPTTELGFSLDGRYRLSDISMATAGLDLLLRAGSSEWTINAGFAHQLAAGAGPKL